MAATPIVGSIPRVLRENEAWVVWKYEPSPSNPEKLTKIPYSVHGGKAESDNPRTWGTFRQAMEYHLDNDWTDGVGMVVCDDDEFVGVDLDHCLNAETLVVEPWARAIVDMLDSYTEITPSGEGLRIFVRGSLPPRGRKRGNFEIYEHGRYLTVTGRHLEGTPLTVERRELEIRRVHRDIWPDTTREVPPERPAPRPVNLDDVELVSKARSATNGQKFSQLWNGQFSGYYTSQSEADLGLCSMLSFWTGGDAVRIDALFRSSGLFREKWDERHHADGRTYGQGTIDEALRTAREFYTPPLTGRSLGRIGTNGTSGVSRPDGEPEQSERTQLSRLTALSSAALLLGDPQPIPWVVSAPSDEHGEIKGGLLAERETAIIGAASGTGKTWLIADIVRALAMGTPLFDFFDVARPCRIMLVDEESSVWLLRQRWALLLRGYGIDRESFARDVFDERIRIYVDQGFSFDDDRTYDALLEEASIFRPDFVLFDTLARIHRRPENDNSQVAALFEDRIKPFKRAIGCGMIFAHHVRKPAKDAPNDPGSLLRGASDLKGQLDQFWFLRGRSGDPRSIFEHDKCRAMPELPSFVLARETMPDGGIRLVRAGEAVSAATAAADVNKEVVLRFLIDNGQQTREQIFEFGKARGMGERTVVSTLSALMESEEVDRARIGHKAVYWATEME
jgi:putative DNA primase/helicase